MSRKKGKISSPPKKKKTARIPRACLWKWRLYFSKGSETLRLQHERAPIHWWQGKMQFLRRERGTKTIFAFTKCKVAHWNMTFWAKARRRVCGHNYFWLYIYVCVWDKIYMCIYIYIHIVWFIVCITLILTLAPKWIGPIPTQGFVCDAQKKTREKGLFQQEAGFSLMKKKCQPTNLRIVISG